MLAILCTGQVQALALTKALTSCTREVEGPFHAWRGHFHGNESLMVLAEEGGADASYAAARLLVRRGAKRILYLGEAMAAPAAVRTESWELGQLALPSRVYDARGLVEVTRVLPDSANSLPLLLRDDMMRHAGVSIKERPNSPNIATVARTLRNPWFADHLYEQYRVALTDGHASGAAEAAHEEGVPCVFIIAVTGVVRRSSEPVVSPVLRGKVLYDALTEFAVNAADGNSHLL